MRRFLILSILSFFTCLLYAQSDVVYLHNGSMIKGSILEMNTAGNIKIQTSDGSVFVFPMTDVERTERITTPVFTDVNSDDTPITRIDSRKLVKVDGNLKWSDNSPINDSELKRALGKDMAETVIGAKQQVKSGTNCLLLGLGFLAGTIIAYTSSVDDEGYIEDENGLDVALLLAIPADALICIGCVFRGIGNHRLSWVAETYNDLPAKTESSNSLSFSPSVMMSSQNDLAFGATLSFRF